MAGTRPRRRDHGCVGWTWCRRGSSRAAPRRASARSRTSRRPTPLSPRPPARRRPLASEWSSNRSSTWTTEPGEGPSSRATRASGGVAMTPSLLTMPASPSVSVRPSWWSGPSSSACQATPAIGNDWSRRCGSSSPATGARHPHVPDGPVLCRAHDRPVGQGVGPSRAGAGGARHAGHGRGVPEPRRNFPDRAPCAAGGDRSDPWPLGQAVVLVGFLGRWPTSSSPSSSPWPPSRTRLYSASTTAMARSSPGYPPPGTTSTSTSSSVPRGAPPSRP